MSNVVLILGATSDIGGEIARRLAPGRTVVLAARRPDACESLKSELLERGAEKVDIRFLEATDVGSHRGVVKQAAALGPIEHAVVAFGILGDQARAVADENHAVEIATVDYTAQVSVLTVLADELQRQQESATIYAFSSIAGWRARRANYVYGSTKAGLDAFCQGLTDQLQGTNVSLITARPGFVIGSMTAGMKPAPLSVTPEVVADVVVAKGTRTPPRSATVWIPRTLQVLALVMKLVPRAVWRKMPR